MMFKVNLFNSLLYFPASCKQVDTIYVSQTGSSQYYSWNAR